MRRQSALIQATRLESVCASSELQNQSSRLVLDQCGLAHKHLSRPADSLTGYDYDSGRYTTLSMLIVNGIPPIDLTNSEPYTVELYEDILHARGRDLNRAQQEVAQPSQAGAAVSAGRVRAHTSWCVQGGAAHTFALH